MFNDVLKLENVSVAYGGKAVVHDVNFSLRRGEILVIVGESGSGKSTILKSINGLLGSNGTVIDGQIFFDGNEITNAYGSVQQKLLGASIGMIFQNAGASFCPIRTVGDQIYESVSAHKNWSRQEFLRRARIIINNINLDENVLDDYPFRLSGGMAQRVGILAAIILQPKLLLADEPTSALDTITQVSVANELLKLRRTQGISVVMVTHHMGLARYMADKVLVMKNGTPVEFGTRDKIFNRPEEIYTRELINAVPRIERGAA